ncbi:MAG: twin-arginine translocase subunit TatC [Actinobacteria bacterium]|nr:twin-arginine translocase subunit TatC [Actinomycetota bacterium]MBU1609852.1 twin-arginine translocase subunit TatC [Actinomycetota bacterium]MBU2315949.1 twin-arginine translocase subunit TatC [Actinomycetota bacterium]MBU2385171.1 twin-arginine translocase subunit TatC [Actinomycetota bacterium]
MSLGQHLVELRKRLTRAGAAILVAAVGGWFLVDIVWAELSRPVLEFAERADREAAISYTTVTEAFDTRLLITLTLGVVIASPFWLYQLWAFIVPALHQREKRYAIGFLGAAVPLFLAGCATGWLILPNIVSLLTGFAPEDTTTLLTARVYLDFSLKLIIAIGIGFVLPVVLVMLNFARVLTAASILKSWRWAIIAIAFFTALATPAADVLSMFLLAIPMVGLYFLAAAIATFHDRRVAKREAAMNASYGIPTDAE